MSGAPSLSERDAPSSVAPSLSGAPSASVGGAVSGRAPPHSVSHQRSGEATPSATGSARRRSNIPFSTPKTNSRYALFNPRGASASGLGSPPSDNGVPPSMSMGDDDMVFGTDLRQEETIQRCVRFLRNCTTSQGEVKYMPLIREMLENEQFTLEVDAHDLDSYDPELYEKMVRYAADAIVLFDNALARASVDLEVAFDPEQPFQVSLYNLREQKPMRDLNPSDIESLISIKGMVTRTSGIIPEMIEACFICQGRECGHETHCTVDSGRVEEPNQCEACQSKFSMRLIHNRSRFVNKQMIKLQESPDHIPEGETPHTCTLFAHEELVDACKPGDRVVITGIYKATPVRSNPRTRTVKAIYKTYIDVQHIAIEQTTTMFTLANGAGVEAEGGSQEDSAAARKREEMEALAARPDIYRYLVDSLAPSVWGMDDVKRGILCQLFGGLRKTFSGGQTRGELNVLLCGDPGVSKSQLLGYVHKIAPRGIYTSGRGSSAVGLTAYVTKDPETREHVLESGALVLSDLGICCIDEFDKMSESARSMLHEVMEQQTVSVAKAGIISTLNARTSVLAAANPEGSKYDHKKNIVENLNLPPSLISRFDLIYLMLDNADDAHDRRLAKHLVSMHFANPPSLAAAKIPMQKMREFVAYARQECHPRLSDEAADRLVSGYVDLRSQDGAASNFGKVKKVNSTPRQLESLIRISEALARMRLDDQVRADDVNEAFRLLRQAMSGAFVDPETGTVSMDIMNTGISDSAREMAKALPGELEKVIDGMSAATGTVGGLLTALKEVTSAHVTHQMVMDALSEVPNLLLTGSTWTIRKP